ncbi:MAG: hypothetical protein ACTHK0_08370 [Ginsengibacter sp.]
MKHIVIAIMLLMLSTVSLSQQTTLQAINKQDYLQKSKQQRNTAWILAGGGLVLEIAGIIAYQSGNASIFLLGAGLISQIVSIPFFVSAAINKKKSKKASLSFNLEETHDIHTSVINCHLHPEIFLKINL